MGRVLMTFAALLAVVPATGDVAIAVGQAAPGQSTAPENFYRVRPGVPLIVLPEAPRAPSAPVAPSATAPAGAALGAGTNVPEVRMPRWSLVPRLPAAPVTQPPAGEPPATTPPPGADVTTTPAASVPAAVGAGAAVPRTGPLRTQSYMESRRQSSSGKNLQLQRSLGNFSPTDPRAFPAVQGAGPNSSLLHPSQSMGNLPTVAAPNSVSPYQGSYSRRSMGNGYPTVAPGASTSFGMGLRRSMGNGYPTVAPGASTSFGMNVRRSMGNVSPSAPASSNVPAPPPVRRSSMGNLSP